MKSHSHLLAAVLLSACSLQAVAQQTETVKTVESSSSSSSSSWHEQRMAYTGMSYNVLDTNYIPKNRIAQHHKFLKNEYQFPAKPRNMWEIGIAAGLLNYTADVPSLMLWDNGGYAFSAHVRKAWGYTFSTRLQFMTGVAKGLQWQQTGNYRYNPAWTSNGYVPATRDGQGNVYQPEDYINYNYRSTAHQLNVDFMLNTNNIRFHKANTSMNFYGFVGLGAFLFNTRINALDANGQKYDFEAMLNGYDQYKHKNYRKIQKHLREEMDNSYETDAENERGKRRPGIFGKNSIDFCYSAGLGVQFRINKYLNIAIEDRITIPHEEDLLDGQRWAEQTWGDPVFSQNNDMVNYLSLGLNFNVGNSKRNVEPLYWINPLVFTGANGAMAHDEDNDGIMDQFDKCPGTPEGIPVDVNGCPLDTDGDGVPDYRDKQLITPTECQPVDEDGIGKCPCPDCYVNAAPCSNIMGGAFVFDNNSAHIKSTQQTSLATLATAMKANPNCKVVITGMGSGSKVQEQRSWDRVEAVITYLSERYGIDRNRFIFQYGQPGDANTITYRVAAEGEDGFSNVPPPFPNLRKN